MKALLEIGIQEWLDPLDKADADYGHFRDSVLFGLFLSIEQGPTKRLTGFGYGLSHYGRAYLSSVDYFFIDIRKKFPFKLPKMPNARFQADISFLRTFHLLKSSDPDADQASLIEKLEEIFDCAELIELDTLISGKDIYKEIDGLLIAAGLFSRAGFHSDTKWFEEMIDPILNFDHCGNGELSYHPDWGKDPRQAWCLTFDMEAFRSSLETALYRHFQSIMASGELSDYLFRECDFIMQRLRFADKKATSTPPIPVKVHKPYIYNIQDLPQS